MIRGRPQGFSLLELVVAVGLTLVVAGGLFAVLEGPSGGHRAQSASADLQARLRTAAESLDGSLREAGSGPVGGIQGMPLAAAVPVVLPYRAGLRASDPAGTFRADAVSVVSTPAGGAACRLRDAFEPGRGSIVVDAGPGCRAGDPACGLAEGALLMLIDGAQQDLFEVSTVQGSTIGLASIGPVSGRPYSVGSWCVPVSLSVFYLRPAAGPDGPQMALYDGRASDLPLIDHVVTLAFEYFGDPLPPRLRTAPGPRGERTTYGPPPPLVGDDDPRDVWGAGENCVVTVSGGLQTPRLAALGAASAPLQPLTEAMLTDGPWCPDAGAPVRYDADLLRIRKVRATIRVEAWLDGLRGSDPRLFRRPGQARRAGSWVPDRQITIEVVPRSQGGHR